MPTLELHRTLPLEFARPVLERHELKVDLFAGGGGASEGIRMATGEDVDIAINHDAAAVAMHQANHPSTQHFVSDVFEVDPRVVCQGRPVGLLWASPDCTYHSKARGAKPIRSRSRKRRALAWVVTRWAGTVRPRIIFLENVEEFADWGPLVGPPDGLKPCPKRKGRSFRRWVRSLERLGYVVEWRDLRACDYGAPTIRKRLFLIARCDGEPIVWPEPTHGDGLIPFRTAAECIDWSIPMCSIFASADEAKEWGKANKRPAPVRPLKPATMRRIARGVMRYVVNNPKPFIVNVSNSKTTGRGPNAWGVDEPLRTVTSSNGFGIATACLATYHGEKSDGDVRGSDLADPMDTVDTQNRHAVVASFLAQNNCGFAEGNSGDGHDIADPVSTINAKGTNASVVTVLAKPRDDEFTVAHLQHMRGTGVETEPDVPLRTIAAEGQHQAIVGAHIQRDFGQSIGSAVDDPVGTVTCTGGGKAALVYSFLHAYYGEGLGQTPSDPPGQVTVMVNGKAHFIEDIAMRMLWPRELYNAQGFPPDYIIDRGAGGEVITKTEQVHMCGNSVSPPPAAAIIRANYRPSEVSAQEVA